MEKAREKQPRPPNFDPANRPPTPLSKLKKKKKKNAHAAAAGAGAGAAAKKKETKLGLSAPKATNFSDWYTEALLASEMVSYYDVSGCYILRPWSFSVWESIQAWFDSRIKASGVKNAYFPLFITEDRLNTEKDHVEGVRFPFFFFTFSSGGWGLGGGSRRGRPLKTHFSLSFFLLSLSLENLKFTRKKPVLRRGRVGDQVWEVGAGPPDRDPPDLGDCDVSREVFFFFSHFQNNFFLRIFSTHFFSPFFLFPFLPSISLSLALSHLSLFSLSQVPLLCQLGPLVARPAPPAQPVDQRRPVGVQAPHPLHPHARVPLAGGAHGLRDAE